MKKTKAYQLTDREISDPESPQSPDWWFTTELAGEEPISPWAYIVSDFQWGAEICAKVKNFPISRTDKDIGHFPEPSGTNEEKLDFALNTISKTHDKITQKISYKIIDLEFVWLWGEFQKALSIIEAVAPEYARTTPMRKNSEKLDKEYAQAWYTLWYEDYLKSSDKKSRSHFDRYFENLMQEIRIGKRNIPESENKDGVLMLINEYTKEPNNLEVFHLTNKFRQNRFYGVEFKRVYENAKRNRPNLPVVGEEYYPLK